MFCSQCGKEIADNSKFCTGCGVAVNPIDYDSIDKAKKSTWEKSKPQRVETTKDDEEKKGWIDGVWHGDSYHKQPPEPDEIETPIGFFVFWFILLSIIGFGSYFLYKYVL